MGGAAGTVDGAALRLLADRREEPPGRARRARLRGGQAQPETSGRVPARLHRPARKYSWPALRQEPALRAARQLGGGHAELDGGDARRVQTPPRLRPDALPEI